MNAEDAVKAETLLAEVRRRGGTPCAGCAAPLDGTGVLYSNALGYKSAPRCPACLAKETKQPLANLRAQLEEYIRQRPCYGEAMEAVRRGAGGDPAFDAAWDAGDLGCGDLVLELRFRMEDLRPGQVLKLTARDPGAPADMPAWCGMTDNPLVLSRHPVYFIRRKEA